MSNNQPNNQPSTQPNNQPNNAALYKQAATYALFALVCLLLVILGAALTAPSAEAKATRIEARVTDKADKALRYVEPFRVKKGTPRRLYVEFADGSAYVFTPCRYEDSRNCFWWASTSGNGTGHSFLDLGGRVVYL